MDFLYSFTFITAVVILGLIALVWWFRRRKRKEEEYTYYRGGHYQSDDDKPPIIRRAPDTYKPPRHTDIDVFNISNDIRSIQLRLSNLERQVEALREYIKQVSAGRGWEQRFFIPEPRIPQESRTEGRGGTIQSQKESFALTGFFDLAKESYQKLSAEGLRDLPLDPLFVFLDVDSSASGSAVGESQRLFRQSDNKQNAFVVFHEDGQEGWLFPNPRISYTESMRYVFPELSYDNFTEHKQTVEPAKVRLAANGMWEMLPE